MFGISSAFFSIATIVCSNLCLASYNYFCITEINISGYDNSALYVLNTNKLIKTFFCNCDAAQNIKYSNILLLKVKKDMFATNFLNVTRALICIVKIVYNKRLQAYFSQSHFL